MKECNKQIALIPLPNGEFSFTETGIIAAQEDGFKRGWKTALEWIKSNIQKGENGEYWLTRKGVILLIEQELNGTT